MYLLAPHHPGWTLKSRTSGTSLLVVGGLHALLLALLVSARVDAVAPASQATLAVQVIQTEATQAQPIVPRPLPPATPKPVAAPPQPTLAAPAEAPRPAPAPVPVAKEAPPVAEVKEAPAPAPAAPAAAVPVAAPLVEPRFDADYLQNPKPQYPTASRRLQEEGKVLLRVFVEPNGRPSAIEVKTSSGSARLDGAALEAVRQWKFVPARRGREPVGAWVLVPISYSLRG